MNNKAYSESEAQIIKDYATGKIGSQQAIELGWKRGVQKLYHARSNYKGRPAKRKYTKRAAVAPVNGVSDQRAVCSCPECGAQWVVLRKGGLSL